MWLDSYYFVLVVPAMLIALWAQMKVKSSFSKYSKVRVQNGMTGHDAARAILDANELYKVEIEHVSGKLSDHYDPKANVIRLSSEVYGQSTVAAVGVAAHEAGHAVQYAVGYMPIKLRTAIVPITNFGASLSMPLVLMGIIFSMDVLVFAGIVLFSIVTLFQLVTLPVEFNASTRAKRALESHELVTGEEQKGVSRVLSAAALTYVAALIVSLANLLRLVLLARRRN